MDWPGLLPMQLASCQYKNTLLYFKSNQIKFDVPDDFDLHLNLPTHPSSYGEYEKVIHSITVSSSHVMRVSHHRIS